MPQVLIVGAGKTGIALARTARRAGLGVRLLEQRPEHVDEAIEVLEGVEVALGSGTDPSDLERAGLRACQVLVAATGSDEVNLVVATLGKYEFGTARVLARVVDPRNRWLFEPDMGVDLALDETQLVADLVAKHLTG